MSQDCPQGTKQWRKREVDARELRKHDRAELAEALRTAGGKTRKHPPRASTMEQIADVEQMESGRT